MVTPTSNQTLVIFLLIVIASLGLYVWTNGIPVKSNTEDKIKSLELHIDSLKTSIRMRDSLISKLQVQDGVRGKSQKKLEKDIIDLHRQLVVKRALIDSMSNDDLAKRIKEVYEKPN